MFDNADRVRRLGEGFVVGVGLGAVLSAVTTPPPVGVALGIVFGLGYVAAFDPRSGTALDHAVSAGAVAVPAWALTNVTLLSTVRAGAPAWTPDGMAATLPALVGWVVGAAAVGATVPTVSSLSFRVLGSSVETTDTAGSSTTRIVIAGGGFAGVSAAQRLEEQFGPDPDVELVLVSESNALLFTPLLAEVAAGALEPTQISSPLRASLKRTRVVRGSVTDVDTETKEVVLDGADDAAVGDRATIAYDHLVLSVGSSTVYFGLDGVQSMAFELKDLSDAVELRNHVVDCFERAARADDPSRRQELLRFVVAGGGFAGAELAGALNDYVHGMLAYYPELPANEVEVVLVHSGERIMPELSPELSAYAVEKMRDRNVRFELETRVSGADPASGTVSLSDGRRLATETLVWTAGVRPDPLIETLDVPHDESGAVQAEPTFAVPERDGLWAVGDCAAVTDPETGERHPATAQYATRAGEHLADNIYAVEQGEEPTPMTYESIGSLAVIGHQTACVEVAGRQFAGLFAWLFWRAVYLFKLPGRGRQIRVFVNWFVELFFPRDMVQTVDGSVNPGRDRREDEPSQEVSVDE